MEPQQPGGRELFSHYFSLDNKPSTNCSFLEIILKTEHFSIEESSIRPLLEEFKAKLEECMNKPHEKGSSLKLTLYKTGTGIKAAYSLAISKPKPYRYGLQ